jgi:RNA-binding protein Musashi
MTVNFNYSVTERYHNLSSGLYGDGDEFAEDFASGGISAGDSGGHHDDGNAFDDGLDFLKDTPEDASSALATKTSVPSTLPAPPKLESPTPSLTKLPAPASTLPPKPTASASDASGALSYSAQVAAQFSQYRQTPSQERQPRPSASQASANSSADGQPARPVRPSEMKDEG